MIASNTKVAGGFSLVEVNFAILLVAVGMLTLFALFPAALREADSAVTDTHTAFFADYVLSGLEANASGMTNWNTWTNMTTFRSITNNVKPGGINVFAQAVPGVVYPPVWPVWKPAVSFLGNDLRYILEIGEPIPTTPQLRSAALWVWSGTYMSAGVATNFKDKAEYFYTEFYYPGRMP